MKKYRLTHLLLLGFGMSLVCTPSARAATKVEHIVISRVQTSSIASATEELIELYNPTASTLDITGWQVQYRSAASKGSARWTAKATIACGTPAASDCRISIDAGESVILASYAAAKDVLPLASGMADAGGQVRLVTPQTGLVQDMVGYGLSVEYEGTPAPAPDKSKWLERRTKDGAVMDTDDNGLDFEVVGADDDNQQPEIPAETEPQPVLPLIITELLPNPKTPDDDSTDEFIEIYNPNDVPVLLAGYALQAGVDWRYTFMLPNKQLAPGEYLAILSSESHIALSNSGTVVRLVGPDEKLLDQTPPYGIAKEGEGWMRTDEGTWQWTTRSTPGAANIVSTPVATQLAAVKTAKVSKTKTSSKSKKAGSKSSATPSAKKPAAVKGTKKQVTPSSQVAGVPIISYWILGGAGVLAGAYALYEYRSELIGRVRSWRRG